jgi:hypothetical protein
MRRGTRSPLNKPDAFCNITAVSNNSDNSARRATFIATMKAIMITIAVTEINGKTCCTGLGCLGKPVQNDAQKRRSENQLHDGFQHYDHSVSYGNSFQEITGMVFFMVSSLLSNISHCIYVIY